MGKQLFSSVANSDDAFVKWRALRLAPECEKEQKQSYRTTNHKEE
jgi:hypothetical protein